MDTMNSRRDFLTRAGTVALTMVAPTGLLACPNARTSTNRANRRNVTDLPYLGRPLSYWLRQLYESPKERFALGEALAGYGKPVIPELLNALNHKRTAVRMAAAVAIMNMGQEGRPAAEQALSHRDPHVRFSTVNEVCWFGDHEFAMTSLINATRDSSRDVRCAAVLRAYPETSRRTGTSILQGGFGIGS
jgi:hypothetical protein